MNTMEIISKVESETKTFLASADSAHDFAHIERVRRLALEIAKSEKADLYTVELAALLHDVADEKLNDSEEQGMERVRSILKDAHVDTTQAKEVLLIIEHMSYRKTLLASDSEYSCLELDCVRDADRIDGLGAIGIARAFAFGGSKNRLMYDPDQPPRTDVTYNEYVKRNDTTINHFHEKLLKLKDTMTTSKGKEIAQERHDFVELFLKQFMSEWELI